MDKLIPCVLTKLSDNPNNLRTKEVVGDCVAEPEVGKSFSMAAAPLTPGATVRLVMTSPIQKISKKETINSQIIYEVETLNSKYQIELYP